MFQNADDTCFASFDGKTLMAGVSPEGTSVGRAQMDCAEMWVCHFYEKFQSLRNRVQSDAATFACTCTGQICNGRAVTMARKALGQELKVCEHVFTVKFVLSRCRSNTTEAHSSFTRLL